MSARKKEPGMNAPAPHETPDAVHSTPSASVTPLVTDVDDDTPAEVAGSDSGRILPLGVSERQVARVGLFLAEKRRLSLEGKVPETCPCIDCGFPTVPEELFCRRCWRERKRVKQLLARWGPNVFDDYPRLRVQFEPAAPRAIRGGAS